MTRPTPTPTRSRSLGVSLAKTTAAAAFVTVLAACGDSTAPQTSTLSDAQVAADVAATSGDAIAGAVADFANDAGAAGIAAATAANCPYDAATKTHVCSRTTERGLAVTRTYQFRDASGTPTQSYDAANTASIFFTRAAEGTVTATTESGATGSSATHRSAQRTVTGLLGDETQRVWNGSGESHDTTDYTGPGGTRHYAGAATETARDVVLKLPRASFPYPASGTISRTVSFTLTVSGARDVTRTVSRTVVATFNGTNLVPLGVNGFATCTLNLDTGKVSGCAK